MRRPQASFEAQPRAARLLAPKIGIVPYRQTSRFSARTGNNVFRQFQKTCLRHVFSVDRRRLCRRGQPQEASRENSRTSECCPGAECDIEWRRIQRLLNCGARRAAFKPYSPDLDPKRPVFMRFFGLSSLSKPIGKPTKSRNFWCSLT